MNYLNKSARITGAFRRMGVVVLTIAAMAASVAGCSNDDGDGSGAVVTAFFNKARSCGVLSDGRLPPVEDDLDAEDQCMIRCITAGSCDDIEVALCYDSANNPFVLECEAQCDTNFECDGGATTNADRCDGFPDCEDGTDEQGCPMFTCASGEMIPETDRCDDFPDCEDGSDEQGCPSSPTPMVTCTSGEVTEGYVCNGEVECEDGSDETNCAEPICPMP